MIANSFGNHDREDRSYRTASEGINSETMEKKDPAVNQHQDDTTVRGIHSDTTDKFERTDYSNESSEENDTSDPYFQQNASIAQDLDDEFDDNDKDRRTLDESEADEDDSDEEE